MSIITPTSSKITSEPTSSDYRIAYDLLQKTNGKRHQELYFPITKITLEICKTLFLNNYEINTIISGYLHMWSRNPEKNNISKVDLESYFEPENRGFIRYFFTENTISCNDFVLFVSFFLYYSTDDILSVLLAMCGVTSNIMITKDQINKFLFSFGFDSSYFLELFDKLENTILLYPDCPSDVYDIKLFFNYIANCHLYLSSIHNLKVNIRKYAFDDECIRNITARRTYYNFQINNLYKANPEMNFNTMHLAPLKVESCVKKCTRVLFTNKPDPSHFDFCIDTCPNKAKAIVLFQIKQRFGYSKRSSSTCFMSLSTARIQDNKKSQVIDKEKDKLQSSRSNKDRECPLSCKSNVRHFSFGIPINKIVPYSSACSKYSNN